MQGGHAESWRAVSGVFPEGQEFMTIAIRCQKPSGTDAKTKKEDNMKY
jgi:hypothetical protein